MLCKNAANQKFNIPDGALTVLEMYLGGHPWQTGAEAALLKARSPSCGCGAVYDGAFTGTLIPGDGVTAELLKARGIRVTGNWEELTIG